MIYRAILLVAAIIQSAHVNAGQNLNEWPLRVLSFAYLAQDNINLSEELLSRDNTDSSSRTLLAKKYGPLAKIFIEAETEYNRPSADLAWLGRHCWIRLQPGFACGKYQERANQQQGMFYVSDPILGERPFLIVITSMVSPRQTAIYRLFEDNLELVYHLRKGAGDKCQVEESDPALFVTYNAEISTNGKLWLYETEGFHFEGFPKRIFELSITAEQCSLKLLEEGYPVSVNY